MVHHFLSALMAVLIRGDGVGERAALCALLSSSMGACMNLYVVARWRKLVGLQKLALRMVLASIAFIRYPLHVCCIRLLLAHHGKKKQQLIRDDNAKAMAAAEPVADPTADAKAQESPTRRAAPLDIHPPRTADSPPHIRTFRGC